MGDGGLGGLGVGRCGEGGQPVGGGVQAAVAGQGQEVVGVGEAVGVVAVAGGGFVGQLCPAAADIDPLTFQPEQQAGAVAPVGCMLRS